jgi:hypothetical protein
MRSLQKRDRSKLQRAERAAREVRQHAAAPLHALVGIFIVNNNPETMAASFLQPAVCVAMAPAGVCRRVDACEFIASSRFGA